MPKEQIQFPSEVTSRVSFFDRLADGVHRFVSSAVYFFVTVLLLLVAIGAFGLSGFADVWYRTITVTVAVFTFITVALLENAARRSQLALHHKLNAHSRALLELLGKKAPKEIRQELEAAVGLEERESAAGPTE